MKTKNGAQNLRASSGRGEKLLIQKEFTFKNIDAMKFLLHDRFSEDQAAKSTSLHQISNI